MSTFKGYYFETENRDIEVEFDDATGMPVIPEGYFWKLKEEYYYRIVELRQRRKFWFSKCIKASRTHEINYVDGETSEVSSEKFIEEAQRVAAWISISYVDDIRKQEKNWAEYAKIEKMMGKYPPKKLYN